MPNETIRVLIVEDHGVTLEGLVAGFARENDIQVVGTATGSTSGLDLAQRTRPHIVLLDLHLPDSSGPISVVKAFSSANARVVVLSGDNRPVLVQSVLDAGAAAYLLKSETSASVAAILRRVVAGERALVSVALDEQTKITGAERHLLKLLARGMKYQDIADRRSTTIATVRRQTETLLEKLHLETREELIAWAVQNGYGSLELDS